MAETRKKIRENIMDEEPTHKINHPNTLEDNHDLISHLPDSLLLHILSLLTMEDVVKTSILSSRWRYLWTTILCLDFEGCVTGKKIEKTTFIDTCLFLHEDYKIRKLNIIFDYSKLTNSLQVDSWIRFATRRNVEELKLDFQNGEILNEIISGPNVYKLPHSLFKCGSLTTLTLCGCHLNLPVCMSLSSLKTLTLQQIEFSSEALEHLTSSCPILEDLSLVSCSMKDSHHLNICITNEHVKTLKLFQSDSDLSYEVKIHAPKLVTLEVSNTMLCVHYGVKRYLQSLKSASFNLEDFYCNFLYEDEQVELDGEDYCDSYGFATVLGDLHHVDVLRLSSWCMQILSLTEVQRAVPLSLNATCLTLEMGLTKWELPGTAYLLKSCLNIKSLTITIHEVDTIDFSPEFREKYDFEAKEYWKSQEFDLRFALQKTKTIKIYSFRHITNDVEIEFVRFLLNHSKVLEKMIISTTDEQSSSTLKCLITEMLASFPRASPTAELIFT